MRRKTYKQKKIWKRIVEMVIEKDKTFGNDISDKWTIKYAQITFLLMFIHKNYNLHNWIKFEAKRRPGKSKSIEVGRDRNLHMRFSQSSRFAPKCATTNNSSPFQPIKVLLLNFNFQLFRGYSWPRHRICTFVHLCICIEI